MKTVIAVKIREEWAQAELTLEVAKGILNHDKAFEEIMIIDNGKLKRLIRSVDATSKPSLDNDASLPSKPQ